MAELLKITDLLIHFHNAAPERNAVDATLGARLRARALGLRPAGAGGAASSSWPGLSQ